MSPVSVKLEVDNESKTIEKGNEIVPSLSSSSSCRQSSEPTDTSTSSTAPTETTEWYVMYRILKGYFDKHGHTRVKRGPKGEHQLLEKWVQQQRDQWNTVMNGGGALNLESTADQMLKLDAIGFFAEVSPAEGNTSNPSDPQTNHNHDQTTHAPSTTDNVSLLPVSATNRSHASNTATALVSPPQGRESNLDPSQLHPPPPSVLVKEEEDDDNNDVVFLFTNKAPAHVSCPRTIHAPSSTGTPKKVVPSLVPWNPHQDDDTMSAQNNPLPTAGLGDRSTANPSPTTPALESPPRSSRLCFEPAPAMADQYQDMIRTKQLLQIAPLEAPRKIPSPNNSNHTEASSFSSASGLSESSPTTNNPNNDQDERMRFSSKLKEWLFLRSSNDFTIDQPSVVRRCRNMKRTLHGAGDKLEQLMSKDDFLNDTFVSVLTARDRYRKKWCTAGYIIENRYYYYAVGGDQGVYHDESDLWWYSNVQMAKEALWDSLVSWVTEDDDLLAVLKQKTHHNGQPHKRRADQNPEPSTERPWKRRASMTPSTQSTQTRAQETSQRVVEVSPVFPLNIKPDWLLWTHASRQLRGEDTAKASSSGTNESKQRCFQKCRRFEKTGECSYGFECIHAHVYKHGRFGVPEHVTKDLDRSEIQVWCHQTDNLSGDKTSLSPRRPTHCYTSGYVDGNGYFFVWGVGQDRQGTGMKCPQTGLWWYKTKEKAIGALIRNLRSSGRRQQS